MCNIKKVAKASILTTPSPNTIFTLAKINVHLNTVAPEYRLFTNRPPLLKPTRIQQVVIRDALYAILELCLTQGFYLFGRHTRIDMP